MLVRTPPQLPFVVVVEPPTRNEIARLLRRPAVWLFVLMFGGLVAAGVYWSHARRELEQANVAHLRISSVPAGARIKVDGKDSGWTPAVLGLSPGAHSIRLDRSGYGDAVSSLSTISGSTGELHMKLWRSAPELVALRSALPGTKIGNAQPLANGQFAATVVFPSGLQQVWLVDAEGRSERAIGTAPSAVAALSPDGTLLAFATPSTQSAGLGIRADEIWTARAAADDAGRSVFTLPPGDSSQELADVTWTPAGSRLLIATSTGSVRASRTTLLLLDVTSGTKREVAQLPSRIAPGSYSWSPNGDSVAFLAQTDDALSLCLLTLVEGRLQYLTDVPGRSTDPIPFAPISWSPDGTQIVYESYDRQHQTTSWFFGSRPQAALVRANADGSGAHMLAPLQLHYPVWYPDGSLAAWAAAGSGKPISLRSLSRPGDILATLPLSNAEFGIRWDSSHDQALIAVRRSSGSAPIDFSVIRFAAGAH